VKISYIRTQPRFDKSFKKLDHESQTIIRKAIALMYHDLKHPSLRFKKMQGTEYIFEISGNMDLRITFHFEKPETAVLRNCGHHDKTLKNP
jgi:mRNA interferase RelE/StbE